MQGANACHMQVSDCRVRQIDAAFDPGISGLNDFAASSKNTVFGSP
jgi:hypothetical protein